MTNRDPKFAIENIPVPSGIPPDDFFDIEVAGWETCHHKKGI